MNSNGKRHDKRYICNRSKLNRTKISSINILRVIKQLRLLNPLLILSLLLSWLSFPNGEIINAEQPSTKSVKQIYDNRATTLTLNDSNSSLAQLRPPNPTVTLPALGTLPTPVSTGDNAWIWQAPYPSGNTLYSITCPIVNICYAVGEAGAILKTTDSGLTWVVKKPDNYSFKTISCLSEKFCAVGGHYNIYITNDGAENWIAVNNLFHAGNSSPFNVSCPTLSTCYATDETKTFYVIELVNNQWKVKQEITTPYDYGLDALVCPSSFSCFAVNLAGGVAITNDGGATWFNQNISLSRLNDIKCLDVIHCITVGDNGRVFITNDGGSNWTSKNTTINSDLTSINCVNTLTCVAVGTNGIIISTNDGGTSWNKEVVPSAVGGETFTGIDCKTEKTCVVVGYHGIILSRLNGSWNLRTQGFTGTLSSIDCPSSAVCLTVGGNKIFATNNTGVTWKEIASTTTKNLNRVSCPNVFNCYAVGDQGTILKVYRNGTGSLWNVIALDSPISSSLKGLSCPDTQTCYAVGETGSVLVTRDGGTTSWISESSGTSASLKSVNCPFTNICTVVGDNGTILTTNNGGNDWRRPFSNPASASYLENVSCPDTFTCFATAGGESTLIRTTDGGLNWQNINAPFGVGALSAGVINCPTALDCYLIGIVFHLGTALFKTSDGGSSWQFEFPGDVQLRDVYCLPLSQNCHAVGQGILYNQSNATVIPDVPALDKLEDDDLYTRAKTITYSNAKPQVALRYDISRYYGYVDSNGKLKDWENGNAELHSSEAVIYLWLEEGNGAPPENFTVTVNGIPQQITVPIKARTGFSTPISFTIPVSDLKFPDVCKRPDGSSRNPCLRHFNERNFPVNQDGQTTVALDGQETYTNITPVSNLVTIEGQPNDPPLEIKTSYMLINGVRPVLLMEGIDFQLGLPDPNCRDGKECIKDTTEGWGFTYSGAYASPNENWIKWLSDKRIPSWNPPRDGTKSTEFQLRYVDEGAHFLARVYGAKKINIIAHSMGGVVSRAYSYKSNVQHEYTILVDKLITLDSPHTGVILASNVWGIVGDAQASLSPPALFYLNYKYPLLFGWSTESTDSTAQHLFLINAHAKTALLCIWDNCIPGPYKQDDSLIEDKSAIGLAYPPLQIDDQLSISNKTLPGKYATTYLPDENPCITVVFNLDCHVWVMKSARVASWIKDKTGIFEYSRNLLPSIGEATNQQLPQAIPNQAVGTSNPTQELLFSTSALTSFSVITVPLTVDNVTKVNIKVELTNGATALARLENANGIVITPNQNTPVVFTPGNPDLQPGNYRVIITANTIPAGAKYLVQATALSDLNLVTKVKAPIAGSTQGSLEVNLTNGVNNTPVTGVTISAKLTITTNNGTTTTTTLTPLDNGSGIDTIANDGKYTAALPLGLSSEIIELDISATGTFAGTPFTRHYSDITKARSGEARFTGPYQWRTFANGIPNATADIDNIDFNTGISVQQTGLYQIEATLAAVDGTSLATTSTRLALWTGVNNVPLRFDVTEIETQNLPGPYKISLLKTYLVTPTSLNETDNPDDLSNLPQLNVTLNQFHRPPIKFNGTFSESGVEPDVMGRFQKLKISLPVDIGSPGVFSYSAVLRTSTNKIAGIAWGAVSVGAGSNQILSLVFYGATIRATNQNGPYTIEDLTLTNAESGLIQLYIAKLGTTSNYLSTEFSDNCNPLVVNTASDRGDTPPCQFSLRQAILYAKALGSGTVTFDNGVKGSTITLFTGLVVPPYVTINADCNKRVSLNLDRFAPPQPVMYLNGRSFIRGLNILGTKASGIQVNNKLHASNVIQCTSVKN